MTATIEAATAGYAFETMPIAGEWRHGGSTGRNVDTEHWVSVQHARRDLSHLMPFECVTSD